MSFKRLETDDFVVSADSITAGLFTDSQNQKLLHFLPHQLKQMDHQAIII